MYWKELLKELKVCIVNQFNQSLTFVQCFDYVVGTNNLLY
jgi:hypothetical protein